MKKYVMAFSCLLMFSTSILSAKADNAPLAAVSKVQQFAAATVPESTLSKVPESAMATAFQTIPPVVANNPDFDKKFLEPVDGVDFKKFALVAYDEFYGTTNLSKDEDFLKQYGFTKKQFDTANEEYSKRMVEDETYTLMNVYGAYFFQRADKDSSKYAYYVKDYVQSVLNDGPLFEKEPMTLEEYSDLMEFYDSNVDEDEDVTRAKSDEIMKEKGMTFLDLQIIGAWLGREASLTTP